MILLKNRFVVKKFELAGSSLHEHEDDMLRLGSKMRHSRGQRVRAWQRTGQCQAIAGQELTQGGHSDATCAVAKEIASSVNQSKLFPVHFCFLTDPEMM